MDILDRLQKLNGVLQFAVVVFTLWLIVGVFLIVAHVHGSEEALGGLLTVTIIILAAFIAIVLPVRFGIALYRAAKRKYPDDY